MGISNINQQLTQCADLQQLINSNCKMEDSHEYQSGCARISSYGGPTSSNALRAEGHARNAFSKEQIKLESKSGCGGWI